MFQEIYQNLNPKQKEAVEHEGGPLLIIAGAGTGKTSVITSRIVYLIQQFNLQPENILAVTFTEKAAEEMEERVDLMLPMGYTDLWINTFHGLCERLVRAHALDIGLPADFELASEIEQRIILGKYLYEFEFDYYSPLASPDSLVSELLKHFSRAKDENITPEKYMAFAKEKQNDEGVDTEEKKRLLEIAHAYQKYQEVILGEGKLDFGDLIMYALKLLKKRSNILKKFRDQFKFILVDEFQDTNFAQYELIKLLAGDEMNLTVCADDDQAIYKWRGASVSNVLTFKDDFPEAKQVVLTENYRSTQNVLDISYASIQQNNPDRLEIKNEIKKQLSSNLDHTEDIIHAHLPTLEEEAVFVLNKMIELQNENNELSWSDFAILVRSNNSADPFINLLSKKGIPYDFVASRGLYLKPEIIDVMSYLRVVANYYDNAAFYRVISMPLFGLTYTDIVPIVEHAKKQNEPLFNSFLNHNEIAGITDDARAKIQKIIELVEKHAKLSQQKEVGEVLLAFLDDSGYLREVQKEKSLESEKKILNISLLFKKIQSFMEKTPGKQSVKDFIEEIDVLQRMGEDPAPAKMQEGPDSVKIMTIHGSKGLEFDSVFVVNMVQGRFPTRRRSDKIQLPDELISEILPEGDPHIQEERRLFYVALTRAKKRLYLVSAEDYGGKRKKKVSPFVNEIKEHVLTVGEISEEEPTLQKEQVKKKNEKLTEKRFNFKLPSKLSYTQVMAFETCPKQYKYRHILGIGGRGSASQSYGNSMHNALAKFYQEIIDSRQKDLFNDLPGATLDRLLELYQESWIPYYYDSKSHEKKKKEQGLEALKAYYDANKDSFSRVSMIEKGFNVKIGDYTFRGVIDRVDDLGDGRVEIVDYKTGKTRKQRQVDTDKQLTLYAIAVEQVFKKTLDRVSLYFLNEGVKVESVRTDEDKNLFVREIAELASGLKESTFEATPGFHCKFCDYYGICEDRAS